MPPWYGVTRPSIDDLLNEAKLRGAPIEFGSCPGPAYLCDVKGPLIIFIPPYRGTLARMWGIAHELGHVVLGHHPEQHDAQRETAANHWASCALIPCQHWKNHNIHLYVNYLRKHYQHWDEERDVQIKKLAYVIGSARLEALRRRK